MNIKKKGWNKISGKLSIWLVLAVLYLVQSSVPIEAAIINLPYVDSGWYRDDQDKTTSPGGYHIPYIQNYLAGWLTGPDIYYSEYRSFFVFDMSAVSELIVAATLRIDAGIYVSSDVTETYVLFDVSTSVPTLRAGGIGLPQIFNDLGTGVSYGLTDISSADDSSVISIDLNQNAISAMNNANGLFAIGGAVTTLRYVLSDSETAFAYTGSGLRELVIITAPEPIRVIGESLGYYWSLQNAYDNANDGDVIQAKVDTFNEDIYIDDLGNKSVILQGGYNNDFSEITGVTSISGNVIVNNGLLSIENILLQ